MENKWLKLGLIFVPNNQYDWLNSHSWVPTPVRLKKNVYRIYFSGRDLDNKSATGFFDFDLISKKVSNLTKNPVLNRGVLGLFDDSLAVGCSVVRHKEKLFMYYVGWQQTLQTRYLPSIGLAISSDDGRTFKKYSRAPILEKTDVEPFGMASPYVLKVGTVWWMWYASYRNWHYREGVSWPRYEIRAARSKDGIAWSTIDICCLGSDDEEAVARPWVLKNGEKFKMWYSTRKNFSNYRIGYAESIDGIEWCRLDDEVGIGVSKFGFDSQMLEYPSVVQEGDKQYLFYNGNDFGKYGIGLAVRRVHVK